jgi:type VI secretion system protein ImpF
MSISSSRGDQRNDSRRSPQRAQLPLLDRLIDETPDDPRDPPLSSVQVLTVLRQSLRRDLEALLNARRCWRSWPDSLDELRCSSIGYGIPDFSSDDYSTPAAREGLRAEIEAMLRRYEPRFLSVSVSLVESANKLDPTMHLRIDALLHADPAPEPIAFDTVLEARTADVIVKQRDDV